ncbi:MAG: alpha-ketoacid dehydrogenase subunit beta, partial [Vicinamibacteria bacterium]
MSRSLTYLEGIAAGLFEEMQRDSNVFLLGEDIGAYGGAFKLTRGFLEAFGPERVRDTPMAESAQIGVAIGAALTGMRPVVEMQFADFISCGFNQIVTVAAKTHYRWRTPVPIVIRCPSGGGVHGALFHSQNPEGWFLNVPGLKIVAPSTPSDAKGLIKSAIRDPNPVLYFEHKALYRQAAIRELDPGPNWFVPIGKANVRREGADLTIVTYGAMVHASLRAAEILAGTGELDVEVIDLRSL